MNSQENYLCRQILPAQIVLFYFPEYSIAEKREKYKETAFCVIIPVHYEQVMNCEVFLQL